MYRTALLATALLATPTLAQDAPTRDALSLAAGYKAQFTCSATFNAGKTPDQITADELTNIYAGYIPVMEEVGEAVIDTEARTVSVTFADDMPPRIAAHRPHLGCSSLPPGATADATKFLPTVDLKTPDFTNVA